MSNFSNSGEILIIGLGGSGCQVAKNLKHNLGSHDVNARKVRFLFIDAEEYSSIDSFLDGNQLIEKGEYIGIGGVNPRQFVDSMNKSGKESPDYKKINKFFDTKDALFYQTLPNYKMVKGAARKRYVGRIMLYGKNDLAAQIKDNIEGLRAIQNQDTPVKVIVISSCSGGTGSSIFYDIIKYVNMPATEVFPVVIGPTMFVRLNNDSILLQEELQANAFAFFEELAILLRFPEYNFSIYDNVSTQEVRKVFFYDDLMANADFISQDENERARIEPNQLFKYIADNLAYLFASQHSLIIKDDSVISEVTNKFWSNFENRDRGIEPTKFTVSSNPKKDYYDLFGPFITTSYEITPRPDQIVAKAFLALLLDMQLDGYPKYLSKEVLIESIIGKNIASGQDFENYIENLKSTADEESNELIALVTALVKGNENLKAITTNTKVLLNLSLVKEMLASIASAMKNANTYVEQNQTQVGLLGKLWERFKGDNSDDEDYYTEKDTDTIARGEELGREITSLDANIEQLKEVVDSNDYYLTKQIIRKIDFKLVNKFIKFLLREKYIETLLKTELVGFEVYMNLYLKFLTKLTDEENTELDNVKASININKHLAFKDVIAIRDGIGSHKQQSVSEYTTSKSNLRFYTKTLLNQMDYYIWSQDSERQYFKHYLERIEGKTKFYFYPHNDRRYTTPYVYLNKKEESQHEKIFEYLKDRRAYWEALTKQVSIDSESEVHLLGFAFLNHLFDKDEPIKLLIYTDNDTSIFKCDLKIDLSASQFAERVFSNHRIDVNNIGKVRIKVGQNEPTADQISGRETYKGEWAKNFTELNESLKATLETLAEQVWEDDLSLKNVAKSQSLKRLLNAFFQDKLNGLVNELLEVEKAELIGNIQKVKGAFEVLLNQSKHVEKVCLEEAKELDAIKHFLTEIFNKLVERKLNLEQRDSLADVNYSGGFKTDLNSN